MGDRIGFRSEPEFFPITPTTNEQLEVMATQAFGTLLENHKITAALGAEYGFTSFLMLQPTLWSEGKPLHPSEEAILNDSLGEPGVNDTMAVRSIMANMLEERSAGDDEFRYVYNFSDVFDAVSEPLYKDWAHVSFKGNQVVAESMFEILKQEVCERPPGNISDLTNGQLQLACG